METTTLPGIAIVGMAGRFPGAPTLAQFWRNLKNGVDALHAFTDNEISSLVPQEVRNAPNFVKAGYVLDDIDCFDAAFFNISARDASYMDPQHRLFLECAWEAMENAGYVPGTQQGPVGVYASAAISTYLVQLAGEFQPWQPTRFFDVLLGNDKDYIASRVCYKLGLSGPSLVVQSACSSSLAAVCLACDSLLNGQIDMALAGGVCLTIPQRHGYLCVEGDGFLSPKAQCRAFDAEANGTVQGNGVGVVVLKRLKDAVQDGDTIHAVIQGFALNNDGAGRAGFTAPNPIGQAQVIREAMAMAGVRPEDISYVEAHGTGTALGDPLEIQSLSSVWGKDFTPRSCPIGSVKTNIGHLNTAAGVAALIKTTLSIEHGQIPPSLHFERPNPAINFAATPFYVNTTLQNWPLGKEPRYAGVSSFGFGGANAHVVLSEAPTIRHMEKRRTWQVLPLSARSSEELSAMLERLHEHLKTNPSDVGDVAYTLQVGRKVFPWRTTLACKDLPEAIAQLKHGSPICGPSSESPLAPLFFLPADGVFSGIASRLYQDEPVFHQVLDECSAVLKEIAGQDIVPWLAGTARSSKQAHPGALCALQIALGRLWLSWGVEPVSLLGHGAGLCAGAELSGLLDRKAALALACALVENADDKPQAALPTLLPKLPRWPLYAAAGGLVTAQKAPNSDFWLQQAQEKPNVLNVLATIPQDGVGALLILGGYESTQLTELTRSSTIPIITSLDISKDKEPKDETIYSALGELWRVGCTVDWQRTTIHNDCGRRVPLPTYPFKRQRFWLKRPLQTLPEEATHRESVNSDLANSVKMSDWFYEPVWQRLQSRFKPLPAIQIKKENWLLCMDESGFGELFAALLRQLGQQVTMVRRGKNFNPSGQDTFSLRPECQDDWKTLFDALSVSGRNPNRVVYFWPIDDTDNTVNLYTDCYNGLIQLICLLGEQKNNNQYNISIISRQLHVVLGEEDVKPEKSLLLGPCLVSTQEYPNLRVLAIDLPKESESTATYIEPLLSDILANTETITESCHILAYRGGFRWVRHFKPLLLEPQKDNFAFKHGGTYIIVGGLGGIGTVITKFLAKEYKARLVIIGRSPLPPQEQWSQLIENSVDTALTTRLRHLIQLKAQGAQVLTFSADIADEVAMRQIFTETSAAFGKLDGIIHVAGINRQNLMCQVVNAEHETIISGNLCAKVQGAYVLERLSTEFQPGFLAYFSSLASFGGLSGSVEYTAANAVLDTWADCPAIGFRRIVINWNYWLGVGMGKNTVNGALTDGLTPDQGMIIFQRILDSDCTHIAICTRDLDTLIYQARQQKSNIKHNIPTEERSKSVDRPEIDADYISPNNELEITLCDLWAEVLEIANVGLNDPFLDLGGDSLAAIKLDARLREIFNIKIPVNVLFTHNTVTKLALYLLENEEYTGQVIETAQAFQKVKNMSSEEIKEALKQING